MKLEAKSEVPKARVNIICEKIKIFLDKNNIYKVYHSACLC